MRGWGKLNPQQSGNHKDQQEPQKRECDRNQWVIFLMSLRKQI